mgnify:CR=1 FL=1
MPGMAMRNGSTAAGIAPNPTGISRESCWREAPTCWMMRSMKAQSATYLERRTQTICMATIIRMQKIQERSHKRPSCREMEVSVTFWKLLTK